MRRCSNAGPRPKSSLMNAALEDAAADAFYIANLWDSVKDTIDLAKVEVYLDNWSLMIRLQANLRRHITRVRKRKAAAA